MPNKAKEVNVALARAVAGRNVSAKAVSAAAGRLAKIKPTIHGIDICKYGICLDYWLTADQLRDRIGDIIQVTDIIVTITRDTGTGGQLKIIKVRVSNLEAGFKCHFFRSGKSNRVRR